MQKQNLTQASRELFRRAADERFASLDDLWRHCQDFKERSTDRWSADKGSSLNYPTYAVEVAKVEFGTGQDR